MALSVGVLRLLTARRTFAISPGKINQLRSEPIHEENSGSFGFNYLCLSDAHRENAPMTDTTLKAVKIANESNVPVA